MGDHALDVLETDDHLLLGSVDNLGVIVWRKTPTVQYIRLIDEHFPKLGADPRGFALMAVLTPECAPVDAECRALFDRNMRAYRDALLGIAIVIEVKGIMGGLTRAIARSMSVVSRTPYPVNTYARVSDATRWLTGIMTKRTDEQISTEAMTAAILSHHTAGS